MKKLVATVALLLAAAPLLAAETTLKDDREKLGYAIGMNIGYNLKNQGVDADSQQLAAGLVAALKDEKTLLSTEEMGQILMAYQQELQMKQMAKLMAEAEKNLAAATEFQAEYGKQDGVVTLESGLQYKELTKGEGAVPTAESEVEVHYRGTLIDGTEFDSSYKRGEAASFPVSGVIPGWTEALQKMHVGDKWQLVIPPTLAYGERGAPPVIPPNSALVFEVELLKILN